MDEILTRFPALVFCTGEEVSRRGSSWHLNKEGSYIGIRVFNPSPAQASQVNTRVCFHVADTLLRGESF